MNDFVLISDGAGGVIVVWEGGSLSSPDIYAQRVDSLGTVLWTEGGITVCAAANSQWRPKASSDNAGGAIIAWEDYRSGSGDIYVQKVSSAGTLVWLTDGIPVCAASGSQWWPVICPDGVGGVLIAWSDGRNTGEDVYAQRVDPSGSSLWDTDGVAVCTAAGVQDQIQIEEDGSEGAVIVWRDGRAHQDSPVVVTDGVGGAFIGWVDYRDDPFAGDVYAQHVDAWGNVLWELDGIAICAASGDQHGLSVSSDGVGGGIIAWTDERTTDEVDIYAQRVRGDGSAVPFWKNSYVEWRDLACDTTKVLVCPGGEGSWLYVSARDDANEPLDSVVVSLRFSSTCDICGCISAEVTTDANGIAIFDLPLGIDASPDTSCCVVAMRVMCLDKSIPWKGTGGRLVDTRQWVSPDLNGDCSVGIEDFGIFSVDVGLGLACRSDFNCDGFVGVIDEALLSLHLVEGHTCERIAAGEPVYTPVVSHLLAQNYPNPFNPLTTIVFSIPEPGRVVLRILDVVGRPIRTVADRWMESRCHQVTWDGRDDAGNAVASGVYFYQLEAPGYKESKKMVLLK
jgi:hypothetical protein